jgi:hypothetical protein
LGTPVEPSCRWARCRVNGKIKALLRRGRGYRDLNYLLLKAQRLAATKTKFIVLQKAAENAGLGRFSRGTQKTKHLSQNAGNSSLAPRQRRLPKTRLG